MTQIGDKFVLWREEYSLKAYKDQFGIEHPGYIVQDEYVVTVTQIRNDVPCMWTGKKEYEGIKAVTEDGIEFKRHWDVFPSDSMNPTYYWNVVADAAGVTWMPVDALQAYNKQYGPPHVRIGKKAKPQVRGLITCAGHDQVYFDGGECFQCILGQIRKGKEEREQKNARPTLNSNGSRSIR